MYSNLKTSTASKSCYMLTTFQRLL